MSKMSEQQFCLRWNNHQPNFIAVFTQLLSTESLVDVTLSAEGMHIQAHKVVLSACSVYFQSIFISNPSRHPIVILQDVKYADLKVLVNFMYYGEVNVSQDQLPQILEAAKMLEIKVLTEMPEPPVSLRMQPDRQAFPATDESSYYSDVNRHSISPCNLSPTKGCKRLRKSSVDSTSASAITMETPQSESAMMMNSLSTNQRYHNRMTDAQMQLLDYNTSKDCSNNGLDLNLTGNTDNDPSDNNMTYANTSLSQADSQWNMLENDPRYIPSACQGNNIHSIPALNMTPMHTQESVLNSFGMQGMINPFEYQHAQAQVQSQVEAQAQALAQINSAGPSATSTPQVLTDPQQPQQNRRRRGFNLQQEENFQRALEAVRFGGIGFCKAAKMYGVNNRTLWLEYKRRGYPNHRPSIKNRVNTLKQELSSPPPEINEEVATAPEQQPPVCSMQPNNMMGYIDSRHLDFSSPMQMPPGMQIPPGMQNIIALTTTIL